MANWSAPNLFTRLRRSEVWRSVHFSVFKQISVLFIIYDYACLSSAHAVFVTTTISYNDREGRSWAIYDCRWSTLSNCCLIVLLFIFISAKWTVWMAEILFSFDMSVCMCFCVQRTHQSDQFKTVKATDIWHACSQGQSGHDTLQIFRKWGVVRVTWPPKFWGVKC